MSISKIIQHFEGLGQVPVSLNDVLVQIQAGVIDERIEIVAYDRHPDSLRGFHYRFSIPPRSQESWLTPERVAHAAYSINQPLGWQRLVCCKELVHCYDREPIRTRSKEDVVKLGHAIGGNGGYQVEDDLQAFFDELAQFQALAILFPFGLREEVLPKYKAGELSSARIAEWVQLPEEWVMLVLTDKWQMLRESILASP